MRTRTLRFRTSDINHRRTILTSSFVRRDNTGSTQHWYCRLHETLKIHWVKCVTDKNTGDLRTNHPNMEYGISIRDVLRNTASSG
eukprot:scaffold161088_cov53-Attheya_sp.AAC.3